MGRTCNDDSTDKGFVCEIILSSSFPKKSCLLRCSSVKGEPFAYRFKKLSLLSAKYVANQQMKHHATSMSTIQPSMPRLHMKHTNQCLLKIDWNLPSNTNAQCTILCRPFNKMYRWCGQCKRRLLQVCTTCQMPIQKDGLVTHR